MSRFVSCVLCLVAFLPCAALLADDPGKGTNYYPLQEGNKWRYELQLPGGNTGKLLNQIAKIEEIDGLKLARLETVSDGNVLASEHLSQTKAGVFRHRFNGTEMTPAFNFLKYPVKKGEVWDSDTKTGAQLVKAKCTSDEEEIEVPAGKFKTVKVTVDASVEGMTFNTTYWFASDVGVVKQSFNGGGTSFTVLLERFEPGTPNPK